MKIPAIKKLIEDHSYEEICKAEEQIAEGEMPCIPVEGEDEGEQLTHCYGAKWILEEIQKGKDEKTALREFTQRVRASIS